MNVKVGDWVWANMVPAEVRNAHYTKMFPPYNKTYSIGRVKSIDDNGHFCLSPILDYNLWMWVRPEEGVKYRLCNEEEMKEVMLWKLKN